LVCLLRLEERAKESTGAYWISAFEVLETRGFDVILVNARYAKNVPGRKTDVSDAGWLRQLQSYGLLRGSFRPAAEIATLRAYMRQRERLVEYAAAHIQHMQKALMEMNLQLHHVVSDITGATGMRIIRAIVAGERDPDVLASMRDIRCHASIEVIKAALVGNDRDEPIFALTQSLERYDFYQSKIEQCDRKLETAGLDQQTSPKARQPIRIRPAGRGSSPDLQRAMASRSSASPSRRPSSPEIAAAAESANRLRHSIPTRSCERTNGSKVASAASAEIIAISVSSRATACRIQRGTDGKF